MPARLSRSTVLAVLAAAALGLAAGCGGDDDSGESGGAVGGEPQGGESPAATQVFEGEQSAQGERLFVDTCGGCHQLQSAGTEGTTGPSLDEVAPDEQRVLSAIESGPGPMPAGLLEGEEARAVAQYVASATGG